MKKISELAGKLFGVWAVLYPALVISEKLGDLEVFALLILMYVIAHSVALERERG